MRPLQVLSVLCVLLLGAVTGCQDPPVESAEKDNSNEKAERSENDPRFHDQLLKVAAEYQEYGLINPLANIAPELCRAASSPTVPVSLSASDDQESHGKKLYYLFAKRDGDYSLGDATAASAVGQVLVKESWTAKEVAENDDAAFEPRKHSSGHEVRATVLDGEVIVTTDKRRELFVMLRLEEDTPGTDNGWVYGTITADGKKVTSAGVVESCARCHRESPERLLGLPKADSPKLPPRSAFPDKE